VNAPPVIAVADNPDDQRCEIQVDGELAGFSQYKPKPGLIAFIHTEIDDRFEGHGLGGKLIGFALGDVENGGAAPTHS
jgi:uncharacterized protein